MRRQIHVQSLQCKPEVVLPRLFCLACLLRCTQWGAGKTRQRPAWWLISALSAFGFYTGRCRLRRGRARRLRRRLRRQLRAPDPKDA